MYSALELIYKSAQRNLLNKLFTETLSDMPQGEMEIDNIKNLDMSRILAQLSENEVLVTNDNYIQESCDYKLLNSKGAILLSISEDGNLINDRSQQEYLDDTLCQKLARLYEILRYKCTGIYRITVKK